MNLILGFGSTESEQQVNTHTKLEDFIVELHKKRFGDKSYEFYHEDDVKEFKEFASNLKNQIERDYDEIEKNEIKDRPERYFKLSNLVIYGVNGDLFMGIDFWHINSRHPMSPDGIALLQIKKAHWLPSFDI